MSPQLPMMRFESHAVYVFFEYGVEERRSPIYGPYAYLQMQYGVLHGQPADETLAIEDDIAGWDDTRHLWEAKDGHFYSDLIFCGENTVTPFPSEEQ